VVEAALDALRDGGPSALTMRGIAGRLDTGPASLYAWVRNQRELHVLVLDAIAAQVAKPDQGGPSEEQLIDLLLAYGRGLFAYPGSAQLALGTSPTGPAHLDLLEECLVLLEELGLAAPRAEAVLDALFLLVTATVAEQDARRSDEGAGSIPDLYEAAVVADPARWPHLANAVAQIRRVEGEQRLADSIRTFLGGLRP
jgi:AcrR family transcriptional regulator